MKLNEANLEKLTQWAIVCIAITAKWRHDIRDNDNQQNDIQDNNKNATHMHNDTAECHNAECLLC